MTAPTTQDPFLNSIAAEVPAPSWTTEELLRAADGHLSDRLAEMIPQLGVANRHSILANYPDVLFDQAQPTLDVSATTLAVRAARRCLQQADVPPASIGLVLGVTSSPARLLPSLVCDLLAQMPELPRTAATLSISYMGCSAIAKVVETARWYLTCHPDKRVLACFMDATTPLSPDLPGRYVHFSEALPGQRQDTVNAMHGFLFGDAAVAMLLGAGGNGPAFGTAQHLTNQLASDTELGTVPDGGSDQPLVYGRRLYTLSPDVTPRGVFYATQTVNALLDTDTCALTHASQASMLLMHTGSARILDGLCRQFGIPADSKQVMSSYRVLHDYGNTIGCSVPLMLAEHVHRDEGQAILVAFGLSFSCGAFTMTIPTGGWTP
jgi:3-oxoacyl-[acyl-carrier-protein] synthase III